LYIAHLNFIPALSNQKCVCCFLYFRYNFNLEFFRRFWNVLLIVLPGWQSITFLLFLLLICLVLLGMFCFISTLNQYCRCSGCHVKQVTSVNLVLSGSVVWAPFRSRELQNRFDPFSGGMALTVHKPGF